MKNWTSIILAGLLLSVACNRSGNKNEILFHTDGPENEYSQRFVIEDNNDYKKLVIVDPWQGAKNNNFIYYITDDALSVPDEAERSKVIIKPVRNVVCTSTTHIAFIEALGETDRISGVSGSDFVYSNELRHRLQEGEIADIGYEDGYNTELIYSLQPDVVLVYGVGSESASIFNRLTDMGIPVLFIADYLEQDPLARAEWIKVIAELLDKRAMADSIFSTVANEYNHIKGYVAENAGIRPDIMLGLPFRDKWFISPGNSYISRLIEDAGGRYIWNELVSDESVPMSLEAVCTKGLQADYWLNTGTAGKLDDIRKVDARLSGLPVVAAGKVYNNNKRVNEFGGNDYWESGVINPQLLLRDMTSIFDPGLFPGYELTYYKMLGEEAGDK